MQINSKCRHCGTVHFSAEKDATPKTKAKIMAELEKELFKKVKNCACISQKYGNKQTKKGD